MSNVKWPELYLPRSVYYQCIWIVKDIDRLARIAFRIRAEDNKADDEIVLFVDEWDKLLTESVVRESCRRYDCIEKSLESIPAEYREGIVNNIKDMKELGDNAHSNTWKYWKRRFIYSLAKNLSLY